MLEKRILLPKLREAPRLKEIKKIHKGIQSFIHQPPVLSSNSINKLIGTSVYFKCENFQKNGAFKIRGAMSAALSLSNKELQKGITTHSSGNHAQGVAKAAQLLKVPAYIVMPHNSIVSKMNATKELGAKIITCKPTIKDREKTVQKIMNKKGAVYIHPYNDFNVLAGQGTVAIEFLKQQKDLDFLLAPVSGGGLLSGISIVAKKLNPDLKIIGTEPQKADDAFRSFYAKKLILNSNSPQTICDGLRANLGDKTFPIILKNVDKIIRVKEKSIIKAMQLIWERMNIIVEPSSAVPLAAILENKKYFKGRKVGIIVTGGNLDLKNLPF